MGATAMFLSPCRMALSALGDQNRQAHGRITPEGAAFRRERG